MNSFLKVAVMLTAYDQMSRDIHAAADKSKKELTALKQYATGLFAQGTGLIGAGLTGLDAINKTVDAYANLEEAQLSFKAVMLTDKGFNESMFNRISGVAEQLGNKLPGTTEDFYNMFTVMIRSGVTAESILNGVGQSAAYLAVALKMPYEEAGRFAAKMKEATGVADSELMAFMDTIARVNQVGVEASEMQLAFARSAGTLKSFGIQGLEASKSMSALFAILIKSGQSGESVGTGITSIMNAISDPAKMEAFNAELQKYGVSMQFFDKQGNFMGVENLMVQLDKLKQLGLSDVDQGALVRMLLGPGADANFFKILMDSGAKGFNEMNKAMSGQASLNTKVQTQLGGLKSKWEAASGTFTNMLAAMGEQLAPALGKIVDLLAKCAEWIQTFVKENPKLAKFILLLATAISVGLMIAGVILIVKGLIAVFSMLNLVMLANPIGLIVAAFIVAALLIYVYWDEIVQFFKEAWSDIQQIFTGGGDGVWNAMKRLALKLLKVFMIFNPFTWIYYGYYKLLEWLNNKFDLVGGFKRAWKKVVDFFVSIWNWFKSGGFLYFLGGAGFLIKGFMLGFDALWPWLSGIGSRLYNAGANIIKMIWQGMKSLAGKPVEEIKNIVQKMRDYLPFSPAKIGPFKDLHKIKIIETIAGAMRPGPMINAMRSAVGAVTSINGPAPRANSGGTTLVYSPTVNIGAGANKADIMEMFRQHKDEILRLIDQARANKARTAF